MNTSHFRLRFAWPHEEPNLDGLNNCVSKSMRMLDFVDDDGMRLLEHYAKVLDGIDPIDYTYLLKVGFFTSTRFRELDRDKKLDDEGYRSDYLTWIQVNIEGREGEGHEAFIKHILPHNHSTLVSIKWCYANTDTILGGHSVVISRFHDTLWIKDDQSEFTMEYKQYITWIGIRKLNPFCRFRILHSKLDWSHVDPLGPIIPSYLVRDIFELVRRERREGGDGSPLRQYFTHEEIISAPTTVTKSESAVYWYVMRDFFYQVTRQDYSSDQACKDLAAAAQAQAQAAAQAAQAQAAAQAEEQSPKRPKYFRDTVKNPIHIDD